MKKISHADQRNARPDEGLPILEEEDAAPEHKATPAQLKRIIELSREQVKLERKLKKLGEDTKEASKLLQANKTDILPKALKAANLPEGTPLGGGASVEMKKVVRASIPSPRSKDEDAAERNEVGIRYMDKVAPDMVDTVLTLRFRPGEEKELQRLMRDNNKRKKPLEYELTRTVNSQSLSAWVRKRDEEGVATDADKINIQRVDVAEVKLPKGKKDSI